MKPHQIKKALEDRGWHAKILGQGQLGLAPLKAEPNTGGLFKCVDGRKSDKNGMHGPKTLGGVYALVAARGQLDKASLEQAAQDVVNAGYVPCVHGDNGDAGINGCGFFKLWSKGRLEALPKPEYDACEGRDVVRGAGGDYETLDGAHSESCVIINLVPDTTYAPQDDQSFVVDAWITAMFDLDPGAYLTRAAETVEKLNGPRVAKIIVP
jgi:hypothetical protein